MKSVEIVTVEFDCGRPAIVIARYGNGQLTAIDGLTCDEEIDVACTQLIGNRVAPHCTMERRREIADEWRASRQD